MTSLKNKKGICTYASAILILWFAIAGFLLTSCNRHKLSEELENKNIKKLILTAKDSRVLIADPALLHDIKATALSGGEGPKEAKEALPGARRAYVNYEITYGNNETFANTSMLYVSEKGNVYLMLYLGEDYGFQGDRAIFVNLSELSPAGADQAVRAFLSEERESVPPSVSE